jgi:hypothetical protein
MAINDTIQTRLQGAVQPAQTQSGGLDSAQAMLKNVAATPFTNPQAEAQELNKTALALFMAIEYIKDISARLTKLEQGNSQIPTGV